MIILRFLSGFAVLTTLVACATGPQIPTANSAANSADDIAAYSATATASDNDIDSIFAICGAREPAAVSRCENVFTTSLDARRDTLRKTQKQRQTQNQIQPLRELPQVLTVESIRQRHLRSFHLSMDQILDAVAPNAAETKIENLIPFMRMINLTWTDASIRAAVEKRNTFFARSKNAFAKVTNPEQDATFTDLQKRLVGQNETTNVLVTDYALRTNPRVFQTPAEGLSRDFLNKIFDSKNQPILSTLFDRKIGARNRRLLMKQQSDFISSALKVTAATEAQLATELLNALSPEAYEMQLNDSIQQEPTASFTREFLKAAITKKSADHILENADRGELGTTNPALFEDLLSDAHSPLAIEIFDRWISTQITKGQIKSVFASLRTFEARRTAYESDAEKLVAPYRILLAHVSSESGRSRVLREWMNLGGSAIDAYVGHDVRSAQRLQQLVSLNPESPSLAEYVSTVDPKSELGRTITAAPKLKALIYKSQPVFKSQAVREQLAVLHATESSATELAAVVKEQDNIDSELDRALRSSIAANAPPALFAAQARPWAAFLRSVPVSERSELTHALLNKNAGSVESLSSFIAQLEPIEGVRDAVAAFLAVSPYTSSNRSDFSQTQILAMFGGRRFKQFFPYVLNANLDGAVRTKFIMATRLNPIHSNGVNANWVRGKFLADDTKLGAAEGFGFRPALGYSNLAAQLGNGLAAQGLVFSQLQQRRGLIVQGFYESSGHSIMTALNSERGQGQVEAQAPELLNQIEAKLRTGVLSEAPLLERRLFTKYWALNADANLISRFRRRAVFLTEQVPAFYNLRVEIHNFPTRNTLARVIEFRRNLPLASRAFWDQSTTIINELREFLNVSNGSGGLASVIDKLPTSVEVHTDLKNRIPADADAKSQLAALLSVRDGYGGAKNESTRARKEIERYTGDQALSDSAVAVATAWTESMGSVSFENRLQAFDSMLEHLKRDGFFTDATLKPWKDSIESVQADRSLSPTARLEVLNDVLKGVIDQVYFRIIDDFGYADNSLYQTLKTANRTPVHFVDDAIRSGMVFALSKAVDVQANEIAQAKNIKHRIAEKEVSGGVTVYNPGDTIGRLRLNKNPMELSKDDIAVFDQMPGECAAVSGFITVGVGARLSHLQLLAKSLKIPNVQVAKAFVDSLKPLDGQWVRVKADHEGRLVIEEASKENQLSEKRLKVKLPKANHDIEKPIDFADLGDPEKGHYAGPKGVTLAKLFRSDLKEFTPDGVVLPFGFFNRYVEETGLRPLLDTLSKIDLKNRRVIGALTAQIAQKIQSTPIPPRLLDQVEASVAKLEERTGSKLGYFFRSDTNVEDLPSFNGAGLNESIPNVPRDRARIEDAIRSVWISPFTEKSIYWRGEALGRTTVTLAEPSIVIMPTAEVVSSGVLITRGGPDWKQGHGSLSANFGIGSVVEAGRPVEEYSFESGTAHLLSMSVSRAKPVAGENGGLTNTAVANGSAVLTPAQVTMIQDLGQGVEKALGEEPHGWDVEWGINQAGRPVLLQARPNM